MQQFLYLGRNKMSKHQNELRWWPFYSSNSARLTFDLVQFKAFLAHFGVIWVQFEPFGYIFEQFSVHVELILLLFGTICNSKSMNKIGRFSLCNSSSWKKLWQVYTHKSPKLKKKQGPSGGSKSLSTLEDEKTNCSSLTPLFFAVPL